MSEVPKLFVTILQDLQAVPKKLWICLDSFQLSANFTTVCKIIPCSMKVYPKKEYP